MFSYQFCESSCALWGCFSDWSTARIYDSHMASPQYEFVNAFQDDQHVQKSCHSMNRWRISSVWQPGRICFSFESWDGGDSGRPPPCRVSLSELCRQRISVMVLRNHIVAVTSCLLDDHCKVSLEKERCYKKPLLAWEVMKQSQGRPADSALRCSDILNCSSLHHFALLVLTTTADCLCRTLWSPHLDRLPLL